VKLLNKYDRQSPIHRCFIRLKICLTALYHLRIVISWDFGRFRLFWSFFDDDDGNITFSESTEYTKAAKNGGSIGLMASLDDDLDGQITFSELWATWIKSPVHNWTNEQLIQWLVEECEISNSKIIEIFRSKQFTGAVIPKLALHDFSYLKSVGVKSFLLRRRMMLKSMDAVMYRVVFLKCRILGWNKTIWGQFWVEKGDFKSFSGQNMSFSILVIF